MAQALFEALAGGVTCTVDNQTAVAVQSLLDSQSIPSAAEAQEEEDLFQCGKCKKQFTLLPAFVTHKQTRCTAIVSSSPSSVRVSVDGGIPQAVVTSFTSTVPVAAIPQSLGGYNTTSVPSSPVPQPLAQGMVLNDDLMTFASLDHNLQPQTLQMVTTPLTSRAGSANVSILSPVNTVPSFSSSGSAFTNTITSNQVHIQTAPQITITPVHTGDKTLVNVAKPSPTKAGRRSAQSSVQQTVMNGTDGQATNKARKQTKLAAQLAEDNCCSKKRLRCQYCDKMFAKNFDLQQHVRAHTGEKPFQCIVCGRAFAQKSNVKKHMATHKVWPSGTVATLPKQPPPAAVVDSDNTPDPTPVNTSQQLQYKGEVVSGDEDAVGSGADTDGKVKVVVDSSYLCQYCPSKFKTYFQLKTHMVQHKQQQVYKCVMKNCGCTFLDLDSFLEHTKTHEDEMSYRCHMCNKYFSSLYELGVHQYSHSLYPNQGPKPGPRHFQCTKCMNKYSTPEALEHHMASTTHSYGCPHCDKVFACERYLRRHLPTHGTEGQFECSTCKKRFKTENYLKTHTLIHTGEKPYRCDTCSACFNRKDKLKRHVLIHNSIKKYRCPFRSLTGCQKEFNRPDKLKAHIVTHSGIKPFKCKECGKGFSRKPHLLEHERGHKADYKFRCERCGRGFFRPKLFHDHKCLPQKDGIEPQVFRPRNRRKIGRPKKRMITVTAERVRESRMGNSRMRGKERRPSSQSVAESLINEVSLDAQKVSTPIAVLDKVHTVSVTGGDEVVRFTDSKQEITMTSDKHLTLKSTDSANEAMLDHYVVHLTETVHENGPTIQTFIPTVSGGQVLHATESASGNLQPITIIEAQPVHMTVTTADPNQLQDAAGLPMMTVSRGEGEAVVATQVVVTDANSGEHTFVTCPAQLVDYGHNLTESV
ncbi:zinc finger protein 341-like isoform X2 [Haliotis rubra]|uniref:zinc finger protein 341-like isoform X2 n=1 Tax=Haliotis rubra TaxID=36100 RepID=UPI001EE624D6|nr:zinc finger protein 341-like isoform X2 [Haliotis rubra]